MSSIEWGADIEVNGVRPAWLADDVRVLWSKEDCNFIHSTKADRLNWGPFLSPGSTEPVRAIKLPADHFAYKALAAGFEPWGGGETAPLDWDGGVILSSNGTDAMEDDGFSRESVGWERKISDLGRGNRRVIGYRKRVTEQPASAANGPFKPGNRVHHPLYGDGTALDRWMIDFDNLSAPNNPIIFCVGARDELRLIVSDTVTIPRMTEAEAAALWPHPVTRLIFAQKLRDLGLIREETPLERFQRETGHTVTDDARPAVEAALAWRQAA